MLIQALIKKTFMGNIFEFTNYLILDLITIK